MSNPNQIFVRNFDSSKLPRLPSLSSEEEFFIANAKILDLEIGCGVGWHPIQYAQANPERNLIAIEHTREKFEKFLGRYQKHDLVNLLPVHANAISWVTQHIDEKKIDSVLILYPNPNPKDKSRRWFCMPFMHELLTKIKFGGHLELATNELFYRDEALEYAREFWNLELIEAKEIQGTQSSYRTHFEKKYLERNEICYNLKFRINER